MPQFYRQTYGKFGIRFTGMDQVMRGLAPGGEVWQRVQQALIRAMTENTEDLLGRSMRDAPIKEGTLRATGTAAVYVNGRPVARRGVQTLRLDTGGGVSRARLPQMAQQGIEVEQRLAEGGAIHEGRLGDAVIGIVGFNTPYALVQHERLDFHHPKGGKAKYLEDNLKQRADLYQRNLQDRVAEALA
jgi:uncharacterized Zn-binding protein involved in type VI secretion